MSKGRIRAVPDVEPEPLSVDEMQASGNKIAKQLRGVAILAAQAGMSERIFKDRWTVNDVRSLRQQARLAALRWNEADALATEILDQVERAKKGAQS
ncbi:hypothetical protein [Rhodococcoides fascians]|uniref:hypothetical protein n=1 Tax=Rhodococcoides fascians TaxID=1828 RepID=UPI00056C5F62|nr:hypothetical protein [Rhodococcus fascians]